MRAALLLLAALGLAACAYDFDSIPRSEAGVLAQECDPVVGLGCSGGTTCSTWVHVGVAVEARCAAAGASVVGQPCTGTGQCAAGLICLASGASGSAGQCSEFCTETRACPGAVRLCDRATPLLTTDTGTAFPCR